MKITDTPLAVSDHQIGLVLGVSQPTVSTVRKELEDLGVVKRFITTTGRDGVEQPRAKSKPAAAPAAREPDPEPLVLKPAASESINPIPDVHAMSQTERTAHRACRQPGGSVADVDALGFARSA